MIQRLCGVDSETFTSRHGKNRLRRFNVSFISTVSVWSLFKHLLTMFIVSVSWSDVGFAHQRLFGVLHGASVCQPVQCARSVGQSAQPCAHRYQGIQVVWRGDEVWLITGENTDRCTCLMWPWNIWRSELSRSQFFVSIVTKKWRYW